MKKLLRGIVNVLLAVTIFMTAAMTLKVQAAPEMMDDGVWFDAEFYAATYPDVVYVYGTTDRDVMYGHYKRFGREEGRLPMSEEDAAALAGGVSVNNVYAFATGLTDEAAVRNYFNRSVFVGDSVMVGYQLYLASHRDSLASGAKFLAATSYATYHANKENSNMHPLFRGVRQPVWKSITQMEVDRVFIMLGTNDLVGMEPQATANGIIKLAEKIRAAKPGIEIHLISMTPVYAGTNKGCLNNAGIDTLNVLLLQAAITNGYGYVDINSYLKDATGNLDPKYSSDKYVHQNNSAYAVWDQTLRSYVTGAN